MVGFDYFSLSLLLGGCVSLGSGLFVWYHKGRSYVAWAILSASAAVWAFGYCAMLMAPNDTFAHVSSIVYHFGAIIIPVAYTFFVISFTQQYMRFRAYLFVLLIPMLGLEIANIASLLVRDVAPKFLFSYAPYAGPLYLHFAVYFFTIVALALFILARALRSTTNREEHRRIEFIFVTSVMGFAGGGSTFFYPFDIPIAPWPIMLFALYPLVIAYATVRHGLFNMRAIASELFIVTLWFVLLMRTILSESLSEFFIEATVFATSIVLGILLIRNVVKEVENREKGERLARYLANANARLRELDKQKTEFVSIASHQLRGPIAAIVGYASIIQEGSYGKVPHALAEPLARIFESGKHLSIIVDDFLNVARIEQGRMVYNLALCDLADIVRAVSDEFTVIARKKGLTLTYVSDITAPVMITADRSKITQVFQNLIDNAIKYTATGTVTVVLKLNEKKNKVLVTVADTGIGISAEEMQYLFQKFNRASNANGVSVAGAGLGLYIAREIVRAHEGWIHIESPGVGRGSALTVELPLARDAGTAQESV